MGFVINTWISCTVLLFKLAFLSHNDYNIKNLKNQKPKKFDYDTTLSWWLV